MNTARNAHYLRRRFWNIFNLGMATATTLFGLFWLVWILWTTLSYGAGALNLELFTGDTPAPGSIGGLRNAFVGSLLMIGVAVMIGTPVGILAGTYLAEFAQGSRLAAVIRFFNDILLSAPSIVIGLFIYAVVVVPMGSFSGLAGALSLAILLLPVVLRTTDEMLGMVPGTMREAALALGAPHWKMIVQVSYRAARSGILTGVLLAVARISGETAPLLFTALSNQFFSTNLDKPIANVPVVIFQFAMSPYPEWQHLAWAGALIAAMAVLVLSLVSRFLIKDRSPR
ncbi:phosphate ABC transporter permease PstA [Acidithiobacillus ferridurans]|jgi:phosphate transport system permease protein|uniref:phosphate ABC transporter permease PstA n=1 Tax=Acidithiobacillus ferridurans TaxID=1232575 RepID=UPI001C06C200|nr:phosphate ABC transporter permease PstA [Acidithiobacillus ferridurans]MBU2718982.1 phosphate ABC transporter permease PstA [Acidithiobacillus ferridurans]MBU2804695.1 phosphate ABC transporter permease PstA [Acidithiobacillus ferridurans]MBU2823874.1 phosphate ABC transporter permease PstA [Acidithiobacillus ferrooxidans]